MPAKLNADPALSMVTIPPCICTLAEPRLVPFQQLDDGALRLSFEAPAGLYQLSVIVDASAFDWEELYLTFDCYGNKGQRCGPWDFTELDGNKPLVPSYWVEVNGQRLGLWFFQRVSLEDIAHRRFRGRMAFHLPLSGEATLRLIPYRPMAISWISARLEADPEDCLEPLPPGLAAANPTPDWRRLREVLTTTHALYAEPLRRSFAWLLARPSHGPENIPLLIAAWHLDGHVDVLDLALKVIDETVALPHWGNPREDGYSHDGDMAPAVAMRCLAWALHALRDELGPARTKSMLAKMALQGDRFVNLALINRDYWGGSVLQDHGWRSMHSFGAAALALYGILPEAERWIAYVIPRVRRSLEAMPRDGVLPPSSYSNFYLYLNELTHFRDALLAAGGDDLFDWAPFRPIMEYVIAVLHEKEHRMVVTTNFGGDRELMIGGNAFFNRMATKYGDGRAARIAHLLLETPPTAFYAGVEEIAYFHGPLWGLLSHDPTVEPVAGLPEPPRLAFFEDSGLAHYRDGRVTLSVQCGPWCGYNAYRRARGPCDRMEIAPGAGHFIVAVGAQPLLLTPDSGYRLRSCLRSCLLIDGQGQRGDVGYPMSIPSKRHHGEEIELVRWDEGTGEGIIRLNLAPAYPEELDVIAYTREFLVGGRQQLICRDHVVLRQPRQLSWLFQGKREIGVALEDELIARFGTQPCLQLRPGAGNVMLTASVAQTDVVWSYVSGSGFKPFDHVRYETESAVAVAVIDFVITW